MDAGAVTSTIAAPPPAPRARRCRPTRLVGSPTRSTRCTYPDRRRRSRQVVTIHPLPFALGLRQGEVLGLRWADVNLDADTLRVAVQLQRQTGRFVLTEPKSQHSLRILVMPGIVLDALREHRVRQPERQLAARVWLNEWDLDFTGGHGEPLEATGVTKRLRSCSWRPSCRSCAFTTSATAAPRPSSRPG